MDVLNDLVAYRAKHALQYTKRIQELTEKEAQFAAKEAAAAAERERIMRFNNAFIDEIVNVSLIISYSDSLEDILRVLEDLHTHIVSHIAQWNEEKDAQMMKKIVDAVLQVFECINQNKTTKVNFHKHNDVLSSKKIHTVMNAIFSIVGIQHESDSIDIHYDMDCSKDEELAQRLQRELQQRPTYPVHADQTINANIPSLYVPEIHNGAAAAPGGHEAPAAAPIVRRPRGRPRRHTNVPN